MKKILENLSSNLINNYAVRAEQYQGSEHLVVPVVMMVEGVHNGSKGPVLYTAEELTQFNSMWNGTPVVISHPMNTAGEHVSANLPELAGNIVGRVFNTHMEGDQLKAEVWVDSVHLEVISADTLAKIKDQAPLQVSVGVLGDDEAVEGDFNGEHYHAIIHNLRPDHLALLPNEQGACSWDDGCGIRNKSNLNINKKDGGLMEKNGKMTSKQINAPINNISIVKSEDGKIIVNEVGFNEISRSIQDTLNTLDTETKYFYLEEVFDSYFVYRVNNRESRTHPYYKRSYQVNDGKVVIQDDAAEVSKDVNYKLVTSSINNSIIRTKFNSSKMDEPLKGSPCKVNALIANVATKYTEADKEWLSTLEDTVLDKMVPEVVAPIVNEKVVETPVTEAQIQAVLNSAETPEAFIDKFMPEGMRESVKAGIQLNAEKRETLIKGVVANSTFTEEKLKLWKTNDLQDLHDSVVKEEVNYSLNTVNRGAAPDGSNDDMQEMLNLKKAEA